MINTAADCWTKEVIKLIKATVFVNPFEEVDAVLQKEREKKEEEEKQQEEAARKKKAAATPAEAPKVYRSGVGKYIKQKPASRDAETADLAPQQSKKKIKVSGGFKDFSSWWHKNGLKFRSKCSTHSSVN